MIPGLENIKGVDIEIFSKSRAEFKSASYAGAGLPQAPAIMINQDLVAAGKDIEEETLERLINDYLQKNN